MQKRRILSPIPEEEEMEDEDEFEEKMEINTNVDGIEKHDPIDVVDCKCDSELAEAIANCLCDPDCGEDASMNGIETTMSKNLVCECEPCLCELKSSSKDLNLSENDLKKDSSKIEIDSSNVKDAANYILEILEEDLFAYYDRLDEDDDKLTNPNSTLSISSVYPEAPPGEPSTLNLFYEQDTLNFEDQTKASQKTDVINKSCQASLHRSKKVRLRSEKFTQTKLMTFADTHSAELVFRHFYPVSDDYVPPVRPERKDSLELVVEKAEKSEPDVDKNRIEPKVKWIKKRRLLPPLPQDYFKVESFWTGSVFRGEYKNREFKHGSFEYPLMGVYESEFKDGHIHTNKHLGIVTYPRGDTFEGEWEEGRYVSGKITFADSLEFKQHNWEYCTPPDRRFFIERDIGLKGSGKTLFSDRFPPPILNEGEYDTGFGVYDPVTKDIKTYEGVKLRRASANEVKWIEQVCRREKKEIESYRPSFNPARLPGSYIQNNVKQ